MIRIFWALPWFTKYCPVRCRVKTAADRRGVTSLLFAVSATAILGFVGLATEVGTWYLKRTQIYNVADAVAVAGALAGSWQGSDYDPSRDSNIVPSWLISYTTAKNVMWPPDGGDQEATEADVNIVVPSFIASLFTSQAVAISAKSVALVGATGNVACALSLDGPLNIEQSQNGLSNGPCYYASNYPGPDASMVITASTFAAQGTTVVGDCPTCPVVDPLNGGAVAPGSSSGLDRPAASYQPPTTNPFAQIDSNLILPASSSGITCIVVAGNTPGCPSTLTPVSIPAGSFLLPTTGNNTVGPPGSYAVSCVPTSGPCAYYNMNITIGSGATLTPGTYLFINSVLTIQGGTVQCEYQGKNAIEVCDQADAVQGQYAGDPGSEGVTLVFTGTSGGLTIGSGATVLLSAPASNDFSPYLSGVLLYATLSDTSASPAVSIADSNGSTLLNGGMYFPNAHVSFAANVGPSPNCAILVAAYLTLGPSSGSTSQFSSDWCSKYATALPSVQALKVVQ